MLGGPQCTVAQPEPCFSGQCPFSHASAGNALARYRESTGRRRIRARGLPLQQTVREQRTRSTVASRGSDPFVAAGSRLQSLLSGVG